MVGGIHAGYRLDYSAHYLSLSLSLGAQPFKYHECSGSDDIMTVGPLQMSDTHRVGKGNSVS